MKEHTLNKLKAERCTNVQLHEEIGRIRHARSRFDTTPRADQRYAARLKIYKAEAVKRGLYPDPEAPEDIPPMTNMIVWIPIAQSLPDDEETVLVALDDGEIWLGFHDANLWSAVDADLFQATVTHWATMPAGPWNRDTRPGTKDQGPRTTDHHPV